MGPTDEDDACDVEPWVEGESYPIELYENTEFEAVTS